MQIKVTYLDRKIHYYYQREKRMLGESSKMLACSFYDTERIKSALTSVGSPLYTCISTLAFQIVLTFSCVDFSEKSGLRHLRVFLLAQEATGSPQILFLCITSVLCNNSLDQACKPS